MPTVRRVALSCVLLLGLCAPAAAQTTYTWNGGGGDGNWSTAANWGGTAPPSSLTDTLISFAGTTNTATVIDSSYGSTLQIRGLTFGSGAGPFTVAGGGPVLEVGVDGLLANGGSVTQVISAPVRLGADQTWKAVGPSVLRVSGPIDLNGYTLATTVTSTGVVELNGVISGTGKLDPHRVVLGAANTYSGGTLVDNGAWVQTATAAGLGTGLVDLKGNSTITITAAGDATLSGGLAVNNVASTDINRLQINNANAVVRIAAGGLSGSGAFSREGTGTLILTGANPFSGTFYGGFYGNTELIDTGGGASMNANSYSIYKSTFHVGPGALLLNNRPVLADQGGRIEFEQSQTLWGVTVGQSTSPVSPDTAIIASGNVTLTLTSWISVSSGTLSANMTGFLINGFQKTGTGTVILSGTSDFTGQTAINAGVLSIDTIANKGQACAIGASDEILMGRNSTLRYTGASAATDRKLTLSSTTSQPATVEVTDAATVLTWNGAVNVGNGRGFTKAGPGTLVLAGRSDTSLGTATVAGGTLIVTGTGGLTTSATTVQSGATLAGKLTAAGANLNVSGAVTVNSGATLLAGTGASTHQFGVGAATFASGSTFAVTVDGGTTPTASFLSTEGGDGATVNFATDPAHPITIRLEKGAGAEFAPETPVTLKIVHTNYFTGTFSFPNKVLRQGSAFVYSASDWNFVTVGFDIVPGSASLSTDANKTQLFVNFTPVPEPAPALAVSAASALALTLLRRRTKARAALAC